MAKKVVGKANNVSDRLLIKSNLGCLVTKGLLNNVV